MPTAGNETTRVATQRAPTQRIGGDEDWGPRCRWRPAWANSWKLTEPVGLKPPLTVAASETEMPTTPPAEALVI